MGCDIHGVFERKVEEGWEAIPSEFEWDCHYTLFGFLAGVRDRNVKPVDEPEEEILEEKSSLFGRLTGFQLSEKIEKTVPANKLIRFADHLERMKLDFDF